MQRSALALTVALATSLTSASAVIAQTDAEIIAEASSAGPADVTANATILAWPAEEGADFRVVRQGTNIWTCLPDPPGDANYEPMCLDGPWLEWLKAGVSGAEPQIESVGVSYMLSSKWAVSNVDPTAKAPSPDNQWVEGGAHIMLVMPLALLDGLSTDPADGVYVMWKDTPAAHVMVDLQDANTDKNP